MDPVAQLLLLTGHSGWAVCFWPPAGRLSLGSTMADMQEEVGMCQVTEGSNTELLSESEASLG